MAYEKSATWKATLAPRPKDPHAKERALLASAFGEMREHVGSLVSKIDAECKGLTVHDLTHLDALWQMADLLCGESFVLNPAEAFVFGGAVLLHDSAMTVAAYESIAALKETIEWKDLAANALRTRGLSVDPESLQNPPAELRDGILFGVLRHLHAQQAEKLLGREWKHPTDGHTIRLLNEPKLMEGFAESIGKVAHSHHWSIDRVVDELREMVGAGPGMPAEWTVNEVKIACLLRCADAAHIDHRRAPTMLFLFNRPTGVSKDHWTFQNKLNQPAVLADHLLYTSRSAFGPLEVDAWWLCVDTLRMIDREIKHSNNVLSDLKVGSFKVAGVVGVESVTLLQKHLIPQGWKPVDAEIRVSDPVNLAKTLGGRHLYGSGALAPVRELVQNSVDAIRARRKLEEDFQGRVRIVIRKTGNEVWLDVEDDGLGMSPAVLTGPLLDFGTSFWSSSMLQREFPGLESRGIKPVGKYGIGFFSIFSLGEEVSVCSRRYDAGLGDAMVLDFKSLSRRPILRPATQAERRTKISTRVSVRVDESAQVLPRRNDSGKIVTGSLHCLIQRLVATLDVHVEFEDQVSEITFSHGPNWRDRDSFEFLFDLVQRVSTMKTFVDAHADMVRLVEDEDGVVWGRAAVRLPIKTANESVAFTSSDGFVTDSRPGHIAESYVGVMFGIPDTASRSSITVNIPQTVLAKWATDQAALVVQKKFSPWDMVKISRRIMDLGGDPGALPFAFCGKEFVTLAQFRELFSHDSPVFMIISQTYRNTFELEGFGDLKSHHFLRDPRPNVLVPMSTNALSDDLDSELLSLAQKVGKLSDDDLSEVRGGIKGRIDAEWRQIVNLWKAEPVLSVEKVQIYNSTMFNSSEMSWAVVLRKPVIVESESGFQ